MSAKKLSYAQMRALVSIKRTGSLPMTADMASAGGLTQTVASLVRRDLIAYDRDQRAYVLTPAGIEACS